MNPIHELIRQLAEPLGDYAPKARTFVVDTHNAQGEDRYHELTVLAPPGASETEIIANIVESVKAQGLVPDGIHEILDGYTSAELEEMAVEESQKHIRLIYLDAACLPEVRKKYPEQIENFRRQRAQKPQK